MAASRRPASTAMSGAAQRDDDRLPPLRSAPALSALGTEGGWGLIGGQRGAGVGPGGGLDRWPTQILGRVMSRTACG
jgi:hypothetical protein